MLFEAKDDSLAVVDGVLRARHSTRAFLPRAVPKAVLSDILTLAARAPSGTNIQPWQVYVLAGEPLKSLSQALTQTYLSGTSERPDFDYYPKVWHEPWLSRRRKVGFDLYSLLGIAKGDQEAMKAQSARNFCFFDAPIALILTFDVIFSEGVLLDYGIFIGHLLTAASVRGLHSCVQASISAYPDTIRKHLSLPEETRILCAIALGYEDPEAPENCLRTSREVVGNFAHFLGF